tara:strand:+ start:335 stop:1027 length:693 start_codon:yes stop_codon:yes gene_type:complete
MKIKKAVNYVKNRNKSLPEYKIGAFQVLVKDPITSDIDIQDIFNEVNNLLPNEYLNLLDIVYIGDFSFLREREANALYMDGAIYISNEQDDGEDLKDDIIHEISHSVEEKYGDFIYTDGSIEDEFLLKRAKLKKILVSQNYNVSELNFLETDYNSDFDEFLHKDIGYDALRIMTVDLFLAPYSITSLREYFGRGFEEYYLNDRLYLKEVCPYIYNKLFLLEQEGANNYEF